MVDDNWQHQHFRSGAAKATPGTGRGRLIIVSAVAVVLLALGGLAASDWLGYTDFGLRALIASWFPPTDPRPETPPSAEPAQSPDRAPAADKGPRVRQLATLITQQQRGIDLMQREQAEATLGENAARQEADSAAAQVSSIENYIGASRLTARQLADARSTLSAATADLNNARRRAKELGEKRQSLATRIAKAGAIRDDAQRESERLTTPMPAAASP